MFLLLKQPGMFLKNQGCVQKENATGCRPPFEFSSGTNLDVTHYCKSRLPVASFRNDGRQPAKSYPP